MADTVCPHPPLMTQVQHFVSRIKMRQRWNVQTMWAYDLDLWPWRSSRLSFICILVLCQSTKCKFWWYYDYSFLIYGPLGQDGSDWSRDLATLIFDLGGHGSCSWCESSSSVRKPSLKFVGLAIQRTWDMICVSINGPGNLDLWPFDLETGMWVESKVHARHLGSQIIHYVHNKWMDRQMDGRTYGRTEAMLLPPFPNGMGAGA